MSTADAALSEAETVTVDSRPPRAKLDSKAAACLLAGALRPCWGGRGGGPGSAAAEEAAAVAPGAAAEAKPRPAPPTCTRAWGHCCPAPKYKCISSTWLGHPAPATAADRALPMMLLGRLSYVLPHMHGPSSGNGLAWACATHSSSCSMPTRDSPQACGPCRARRCSRCQTCQTCGRLHPSWPPRARRGGQPGRLPPCSLPARLQQPGTPCGIMNAEEKALADVSGWSVLELGQNLPGVVVAVARWHLQARSLCRSTAAEWGAHYSDHSHITPPAVAQLATNVMPSRGS